MQWEDGLGINSGGKEGYVDEETIVGKAHKLKISHHLAHTYSAAA